MPASWKTSRQAHATAHGLGAAWCRSPGRHRRSATAACGALVTMPHQGRAAAMSTRQVVAPTSEGPVRHWSCATPEEAWLSRRALSMAQRSAEGSTRAWGDTAPALRHTASRGVSPPTPWGPWAWGSRHGVVARPPRSGGAVRGRRWALSPPKMGGRPRLPAGEGARGMPAVPRAWGSRARRRCGAGLRAGLARAGAMVASVGRGGSSVRPHRRWGAGSVSRPAWQSPHRWRCGWGGSPRPGHRCGGPRRGGSARAPGGAGPGGRGATVHAPEVGAGRGQASAVRGDA